jgi:hypothetical protein
MITYQALQLSSASEVISYNIYQTKSYDTVDTIARKFLPTHEREYGKNHIEEYINDLKFWNPKVSDWEVIPVDTEIYIDYPFANSQSLKVTSTLKSAETLKPESEDVSSDEISTIGKYKFFTTFTLSTGSFAEKIPNSSSGIQGQQNSPLTIGFGGNYIFSESVHMFTFSTYYSFLTASRLTRDNVQAPSSAKIPDEIGANLYLQSRISKEYNLSIYEGLDYERFATFNTKDFIQNNAILTSYQDSILLATLGICSIFNFNDFTITSKVSVAQIFSSTSNAPSSGNSFFGQRILVFASVHGADKFSYNFLYKKHSLDGPTSLIVERIGLGISYDLN